MRQQQIIPQVFAAHTHTNYLYRMTVLCPIAALAARWEPTSWQAPCPLALRRVPSRRQRAPPRGRRSPSSSHSSIRRRSSASCLPPRCRRLDDDVRYFASRALQAIRVKRADGAGRRAHEWVAATRLRPIDREKQPRADDLSEPAASKGGAE